MADLFIYREKISSLFQIVGTKEDSISYSVGYALSKCNVFLKNFLQRFDFDTKIEIEKIQIRLQDYEEDKGFTDFELIQAGDFHIIIEAKKGWVFPSKEQLEKYSARSSFLKAKEKRMVILNESNHAFTKTNFEHDVINSVPVQVISWKEIENIAKESITRESNANKYIMRDLVTYLKIVGTMKKIDSNLVYIVSIGKGNPENSDISWLDIVNRRYSYFHPVGGGKGGWPNEPPNYIAFRYSGKLQSIHYIEEYTVFTNPNEHFKEIPSSKWSPHYLYKLGPAIKPNKEVKSGKRIVRSMRVWAMLDLLLTSSTIEEARDKTKDRLEK